jgi:four helix bundle protein
MHLHMNHSQLNLSKRTIRFSKEVIALARAEKLTVINQSMMIQLIKSATSIGANYSEANNAASKADFRSKIFIAKKEAAETEYWLEVLSDVVVNRNECLRLKQECHYMLMTLQKIVSTLKQGKGKTSNAGLMVNGEM